MEKQTKPQNIFILVIVLSIAFVFILGVILVKPSSLPNILKQLFSPRASINLSSSSSSTSTCGPDNACFNKDNSLIKASLVVNDKKYNTEIQPQKNIYNLMEKLASTTDFKFKTKEFQNVGIFVEEINGQKNDAQEKMYWMYYVNGKIAEVGINQYIIKTGDEITWKYEKSKY